MGLTTLGVVDSKCREQRQTIVGGMMAPDKSSQDDDAIAQSPLQLLQTSLSLFNYFAYFSVSASGYCQKIL